MKLLLWLCLVGLAVGLPAPEATPFKPDEAVHPQEETDKKSDASDATPFQPKDQEPQEPKHEAWEEALTFLESLTSNQEPKDGSPKVPSWKDTLLGLASSVGRPSSVGPNQDGTRLSAEEESIIRKFGQEMYTYDIGKNSSSGLAISSRLHNDPRGGKGNSLVNFFRGWLVYFYAQYRVDPDTGHTWKGYGLHPSGRNSIVYDTNDDTGEASLNINWRSDDQF